MMARYYAQDCAFWHPLCAVAPGRNSRAKMLAILQWYRIMSPALEIHVSDATYDHAKMTAFLDITQTFHIRWSPLRPAPARYAHLPRSFVTLDAGANTHSGRSQVAGAPPASP